jgi:hypothetical protein
LIVKIGNNSEVTDRKSSEHRAQALQAVALAKAWHTAQGAEILLMIKIQKE